MDYLLTDKIRARWQEIVIINETPQEVFAYAKDMIFQLCDALDACRRKRDEALNTIEDIQRLASELMDTRSAIKPCTWAQSNDWDESDVWDTTCGNTWYMDEGTPSDNNMNFCPYCGGKLIEKKSFFATSRMAEQEKEEK